MLRLQREGSAQELSGVYHSKYTEPADTLHSVGKELSIHVRKPCFARYRHHCIVAYRNSEVFGTSEDETSQLDHSEDAENGNNLLSMTTYSLLIARQPRR